MRRTSHREYPDLSGPPSQPKSFPSLWQEGQWETGRTLHWEEAVGLKGRLGANQCLLPSVCPPDVALSSALEATSSFGFLLFVLHLLNYPSFQGPHLFNAVITGGVGVLLSALYSANTHFPPSTGQWLWGDTSAPLLPFLGAEGGVGNQATLSPTGTSLSCPWYRTALSHSWIHPSRLNIPHQRCSHPRVHLESLDLRDPTALLTHEDKRLLFKAQAEM